MPLALRFAFRRLAKSPQFTLLSILLLGFGIAMSTTAFGIANGALLRELPFDRPEQLVRVFTASRQGARLPVAPGYALELRDALHDIGEFTLYQTHAENVAEPGQPAEQQQSLSFDVNGLTMLGIQPLIGRGFVPDDGKPGSSAVVMLTHRWWIERFGGDPAVIGKTLRIEAENHTIVGVLPPRFDEPLVWYGTKYVRGMVIWPGWYQEHVARWMNVMGRLKPGVTLEQAQVRLDALAAKFAHDYPEKFANDKLRVVPLGSSFVGVQGRTLFWLVVGLAASVLLIACANLGGVQLARSLSRSGELAIRSALGATRWHLILAIAVESVILGLAGTIAGVLLTYWSRPVLQRLLFVPTLPIDGRVLGFAGVCGTLAVVIFGVVPAWLITRSTMAEAMKDGSRGSTGGRTHHRVKYTLIVGQLGLALVLVTTALSLVLGVRTSLRRDRGWQPGGLVAGAVHAPYAWVAKDQTEPKLARLIEERVAAIPEVESVGVASNVPLYGEYSEMPILSEGMEMPAPGREPIGAVMATNADFFRTVAIPLREGRLFPAEWRKSDPFVTVVGASTAQHFWPAGNAIGKRIRFGRDGPWHEVIGIVGDVNFTVGFSEGMNRLQAYRPVQEMPSQWYNVVVRTSVSPASFERSYRAALAEIDADIVGRDVGSVPQLLATFASDPFLTTNLVTFAIAGLVIAMIGLYGVISHLTQQRRREIGIRLALGATYERVLAMLLGHGGRLLVYGMIAGSVGAWAAGFLLRRGMPTLPALGWFAQLLIGLVLAGAGMVACYLPAHRAARLNPAEVLRSE